MNLAALLLLDEKENVDRAFVSIHFPLLVGPVVRKI
jgi:hypothetical protein